MPGLGKHIAGRLKDVNRPVTVRKLLMDIASTLKYSEAVGPAVAIVLDGSQDIRVREWATMLVRKLGIAEDAARVDGPIAMYGGRSDDERSLCGTGDLDPACAWDLVSLQGPPLRSSGESPGDGHNLVSPI